MKLPYTEHCKLADTDTLTVDVDTDGDIALRAQGAGDGQYVSLYLDPSDARKLRRALKAAILKSESEAA